MNEQLEKNKLLYDISVLNEDDSILDFKSPEQSPKANPTEFSHCDLHKKKKTAVKFKNFVKNHKGEKYRQQPERKRSSQQPSIESSFFKPKTNCDDSSTDVKVALVCPLCFKTFKDLNSRSLHMKICAFKNNITTKKLLDAIELQKRQENERKSLGLLVAPVVQDKKKPTPSCRKNLCEETDLQLALALSKSLQEAEELDKINEIESLPKILNQFVPEIDKSVYEGQLEKFGFANSKPPSLIKNRKRKNNERTLLQTRSQEERNHILTEKISEILMGNEPVTQNENEAIKCNRMIEKKNNLKSHSLQEFCNKDEKLWNKAKLSSDQKCFYVSSLSNYITPGRKQVKEETILDFANTCNIYDMESSQYQTKLCNYSKKIHEIPHTEACFVNEKCENYQNIQFTDTIITNWSNALNDSSASDIIIFVNNDKYIWAHKLVLYVQCSNILLDVTPNDTLFFTKIKEKISWGNISYNIALAFLEFIYCGIIKKYLDVLDDLASFPFLRNLARKYKVTKLFVFLEKKEVEIKQMKSQMHNKQDQELISKEKDNLELTNNNIQNVFYDIKDSKLDDDKELNKCHLDKYINKPDFVEIELRKDTYTDKLLQEEINCLSDTNTIRNTNTSPDLFDDINNITQSEVIKNKTKYVNEVVNSKKAKDNESSSLIGSVNQVMIDPANISTSGNTIFKSTEQDVNLFSDTTYFATPKKDSSNILELKSNLSIFIEQVQRENARSDSDIDSDVSVIPTCSKLYRNPFNIGQNDSLKDTIIKETFNAKSDILSIFDCNTTSKSGIKMSYEENNSDICHSFESIDSISQSSESNIEKSAKRCKNSSINKSINNAHKDLQDEVIHSISKENENENNVFSDSDTDSIAENEISMYSRYKKGHENNSIVKYRNFTQKHISKNNVKANITYDEYQEKNNIGNDILLLDIDRDSKFQISQIKKCDENEDETKKIISDFEEDKKISQQNLCNFNNEYVTFDENNYFCTNVESLNTQKDVLKDRRLNNSNKLRYSKSESNIDLQAVKKNSFTSLESSTNKYNSVETSILVCSSPELDYNILEMHKYEENKRNTSGSYCKSSEDNSRVFENDTYLANAYIDNSDGNTNTPLFTKKVNQLEKFKSNGGSLSTKKYSRKFQRKSLSETSLRIDTRHTKNDIPESYNNSQCICNYKEKLKAITSPEIIRDSITPPPNYNDMKTSELQMELNKYGLKIQKRKRAVKLLTYIYNELHPTINTSKDTESELTIISSEDDEPPMKKTNNKKDDVDCIHNYESQLTSFPINADKQLSINTIDEINQFDEPEFTPVIDNASNIKDMFLKFLTARTELHNKILAYEPICINSLHSMLKTEGFKCRMSILMDFLDEQCITFYVQETK
ncbi:reticulocyte-binding protein PFD0110w [Bombus impatiens]|uniref:Structure-specific endonuclease subunit SLX4 n=1 Tax=Bombus impatiens TaxID=132113 RepID=A0A6P3V564_BOMIM|nr:reticulocyte-binding protein PFD0110w [Bombus impatiens]XP_012247901.1 reticulocyte-binding protein PFD0110w [Bombus impatiens]XP_024227305.1 reticulocyte-binding protein PFD0110w [Bombus impatiens]